MSKLKKLLPILFGFIIGVLVCIVFYTSFFMTASVDSYAMRFHSLIAQISNDMGQDGGGAEFGKLIESPNQYKGVSYILWYENGDVIFSTKDGQTAILRVNENNDGERFISCFAVPKNITNCDNFKKYID